MPAVSVGRIVHYYQGDHEAPVGQQNPHWSGSNGSRVHPAIVTRVWSEDCVNLIVFVDAVGQQVRTSALRLPDEVFAEGVHCTASGWRWPERIG